jgi:hypothetical protein
MNGLDIAVCQNLNVRVKANLVEVLIYKGLFRLNQTISRNSLTAQGRKFFNKGHLYAFLGLFKRRMDTLRASANNQYLLIFHAVLPFEKNKV